MQMDDRREELQYVSINTFPMPNSLFKHGLGVKEISIFCLLTICAYRRKNPVCLSCTEIASALNISKSTVIRHMKTLKKLGLVPKNYKKRKLNQGESPWKDAPRAFFLVPTELFGIGLCAEEIVLFCYLISWTTTRKYNGWPSYDEIAEALCMCKNTVMKYVSSLEHKGLISTRHTNVLSGTGELYNSRLSYTLRSIGDVRVKHNKQELLRAAEEEKKRKLLEKAKKAGLTVIPHEEADDEGLPF